MRINSKRLKIISEITPRDCTADILSAVSSASCARSSGARQEVRARCPHNSRQDVGGTIFKLLQNAVVIAVLLFMVSGNVQAQTAPEVTVALNEQFLNSFLDAVFTNLETPRFPIAKKKSKRQPTKKQIAVDYEPKKSCEESITLLREANGVRTAIKFGENKITAPLAFSGTYDFPFVGCSNFTGWAEANLNLEYDRARQTLFGRVKVNKVDLKGIPNLASGVVAKLVQGSIDSRVNPIEILRAEQVSAVVPVTYANGSLKLRAIDMKPEIKGDALNVRVAFEFTKAQ